MVGGECKWLDKSLQGELSVCEKPFMLREPQHERKIVNVINVISVRPELSRRASHFFHTL